MSVEPRCEAIDFVDPVDRRRVVVEWLLANICNYRCSYCPDSLHDGSMAWPERDVVERFVRRVARHYSDRDVTFLLTGGEPTLYPDLFPTADLVHEVGASVAVLSNGSRTKAWWDRALPRVDQVILSYHREQVHRRRFVELVAHLAPRVPVEVNLVMVAEVFDELLGVADEIEQAAPEAVVHRKPVMDAWTDVYGYDDDQRALLVGANAGRPPAAGAPSLLKGDLVQVAADGAETLRSPFQMIVEATNRWRGWECDIGQDTMFVRGADVYRAVCEVGGRLGSVADAELELPTGPVTCDKELCTCVAGIKSGKRRSPWVGVGLPRSRPAGGAGAGARGDYERDGFCFTPPLVPPEVVDAAVGGMEAVIAGEYETGIEPYKRQWQPGDDPSGLVKIGQPHGCNRAIFDLVTHPALGRWAAGLTGADLVQAIAVDLFSKAPAAHDDANVGWHQDSPFLRSWEGEVLTAWIALSDVTEETSPLLYVRGSHRFGELVGTDFDQTDLERGRSAIGAPEDLEWEEVPAVLERGAVAFHHRMTLHASGRNRGRAPRLTIAVRLRTERARPVAGTDHPHAVAEHLADPVAAPVLYRA